MDSSSSQDTFDLEALILQVKGAQQEYAHFSQTKVDEIFRAAAMAANQARIPLAQLAVEETGMGLVEDKVIKNHFAAEFIYNKYRNEKTCGVIDSDEAAGWTKSVEPVGILAGVIPTTNPTSTAIFKALLALKTRNAIIFAPHPRAKRCTVEAARLLHDAAVAAGAPPHIIGWIPEPSVETTGQLMRHPDTALILATGGPGMVKAAYSSGTPSVGVGAGNTPAVIDETADVVMAVSSIIVSKTFDHGMICASEQTVVVVKSQYRAFLEEFKRRGGVLVTGEDRQRLANLLFVNGKLNPAVVGQSAMTIARLAGIQVPENTKVLAAEAERIDADEPFAYEKLSPILGIYKAGDFNSAVDKARKLVEWGGLGHTAVLYTDPRNTDRRDLFTQAVKTARVLINMPSSQGAIGDVYNFRLEPSLTLGCGSWGGNSVSENVGVKHLLNIKTTVERRHNMQWFRVPPKIYHEFGCLGTALSDLADRRKVFIVTDKGLRARGVHETVTKHLARLNLPFEVFSEIDPDPTLSAVQQGVERLRAFQPDTILALGGGSPMDAAKIMAVLYEHPEVDFADLAMRFMDIRKRIYTFPEMGRKAILVAVPTTSGTGSEVTPFAVVTDDNGNKYPIADYALTPHIAIIDPELVMNIPPALTAAGGIDALVHAIEALVSVMATDYTNALSLEAIRLLFGYLPDSYRLGAAHPEARAKVHQAATMAGMSFANAFLGICHSLAHKLGAAFHIPHGVANALLICQVIPYNAVDAPTKQASFSRYTHPDTKFRYARIVDYLGWGGNSPEEKVEILVSRLEELKATLGIPASIQAWGVSEKDFLAQLDELALKAFDDQCTGANPRYPLVSELKQLYCDAFYGTTKPLV